MSRGERAWRAYEIVGSARLRLLGADSLMGALLGHAPAQARLSLPATAASAWRAAAAVSMQSAVTVSTAHEGSVSKVPGLAWMAARRISGCVPGAWPPAASSPSAANTRAAAPVPRAPSDARRLRKGSAQSLPEPERGVRRRLCWSSHLLVW
jgi:hypothetical protein